MNKKQAFVDFCMGGEQSAPHIAPRLWKSTVFYYFRNVGEAAHPHHTHKQRKFTCFLWVGALKKHLAPPTYPPQAKSMKILICYDFRDGCHARKPQIMNCISYLFVTFLLLGSSFHVAYPGFLDPTREYILQVSLMFLQILKSARNNYPW